MRTNYIPIYENDPDFLNLKDKLKV